MRLDRTHLALGSLLLALTACEMRPGDEPLAVGQLQQGIEAFCVAQVDGTGPVEVEEVYVPGVVACENGAADFEALKAQAVAARSFLYYKLQRQDSIGDSQRDQVFSCGRPPSEIHRRAAAETAGQVLTYQGEVIAAFYVAGAIPTAADCRARAGDSDRFNTERYVTWNVGQRGDAVTQTPLGWVNPGNIYNRGCKSQNAAHCLSESGWVYQDILRAFYGEDIGLEQAEGACVMPMEPPPEEPPPEEPPPVEPPPEGARCDAVTRDAVAVIDEASACFERECRSGDWWRPLDEGYAGAALYTWTIDARQRDCAGTWRLNVQTAGAYDLEVYLFEAGPLTSQAAYQVHHNGQTQTVTAGQSGHNGWLYLGTFDFAAGEDQWVRLDDATGEPYVDESSPRVLFDAIRLIPASEAPDPGPGEDPGPDPDPDPGEEPGSQDPSGDPDRDPEVPHMDRPDPSGDPGGAPGGSPGVDPGGLDTDGEARMGRAEHSGGCASAPSASGARTSGTRTSAPGWPLALLLAFATRRRWHSKAKP